jgi:hypothetical protein
MVPVFVPGEHFTLAWTHSVEKVRWEEDYRVDRLADGSPRLQLTQARIQGSAAGMEPPEDAVLVGGWYRYPPKTALPAVLRLTRSSYTDDYQICTDAVQCLPMGHWLPSQGDITELWACSHSSRALRPSPAPGMSD